MDWYGTSWRLANTFIVSSNDSGNRIEIVLDDGLSCGKNDNLACDQSNNSLASAFDQKSCIALSDSSFGIFLSFFNIHLPFFLIHITS